MPTTIVRQGDGRAPGGGAALPPAAALALQVTDGSGAALHRPVQGRNGAAALTPPRVTGSPPSTARRSADRHRGSGTAELWPGGVWPQRCGRRSGTRSARPRAVARPQAAHRGAAFVSQPRSGNPACHGRTGDGNGNENGPEAGPRPVPRHPDGRLAAIGSLLVTLPRGTLRLTRTWYPGRRP